MFRCLVVTQCVTKSEVGHRATASRRGSRFALRESALPLIAIGDQSDRQTPLE